MLISTLIAVASTLVGGTNAYVVRADQTPNIDVNELEFDIAKLKTGLPVESGIVRDEIIPELANLTLSRLNGTLVYDIPTGGIDISEELYEKLAGKKPQALDKRACSSNNPCGCGTHRVWDLQNVNWSKFLGTKRVMSSPLCGPGSITNSFTKSYSYGITGTVGVGFGPIESIFKGIDLSVGFTYTWGTSTATGYTSTCGDAHPCIATFQPYIGQVVGRARWRELSNGGNKLCSSGIAGNVEIHIPATTRGCTSGDCGTDGVWDHCYYLGAKAKAMCANIGPTPRPECAGELYPGGRP